MIILNIDKVTPIVQNKQYGREKNKQTLVNRKIMAIWINLKKKCKKKKKKEKRKKKIVTIKSITRIM